MMLAAGQAPGCVRRVHHKRSRRCRVRRVHGSKRGCHWSPLCARHLKAVHAGGRRCAKEASLAARRAGRRAEGVEFMRLELPHLVHICRARATELLVAVGAKEGCRLVAQHATSIIDFEARKSRQGGILDQSSHCRRSKREGVFEARRLVYFLFEVSSYLQIVHLGEPSLAPVQNEV